MMAKRVRIQAGSNSPIRVSANDADNDDTFALIFDGNQSPLRIAAHGWAAVSRYASDDTAVVFLADAGVGYSSAAGTWPLFTCSGYTPADGAGTPARARAPYTTTGPLSGFGGLLANGRAYAACFTTPIAGVTTYYVNFMIFRNIG